jgi:hypothetical protein
MYNKTESAGYKKLNIVFVVSWRREKRREKVSGLFCKS